MDPTPPTIPTLTPTTLAMAQFATLGCMFGDTPSDSTSTPTLVDFSTFQQCYVETIGTILGSALEAEQLEARTTKQKTTRTFQKRK